MRRSGAISAQGEGLLDVGYAGRVKGDLMSKRGSRRSIRLDGYDYSQTGAYFITIYTHQRKPILGTIRDGQVVLSVLGEIVEEEWLRTERLRSEVSLDEYVIMPNHLHAIIQFAHGTSGAEHVGAHRDAPLQRPALSLGSVVANFKGLATWRVRESSPEGGRIWQRNYYEGVVRGPRSLARLRTYVRQNPLNWELDRNFAV